MNLIIRSEIPDGYKTSKDSKENHATEPEEKEGTLEEDIDNLFHDAREHFLDE